jgi:hypothetical protein
VLRLAQPVVHEAGPVVAQVRDALPDVTAILRGAVEARRDRAPGVRQHGGRAAGRLGRRPGRPHVHARPHRWPDDRVRRLDRPYYDANGHYVRIALAGNVTSASNAGSLLPTPPPGAFNEFRQGIANRCPGAASQPAPDKSNPFDAPRGAVQPEGQPVRRLAGAAAAICAVAIGLALSGMGRWWRERLTASMRSSTTRRS